MPKTYADLTDAEIHEMSVGDRVERARLQRMRLQQSNPAQEFDKHPKVIAYREGGFNTTTQRVHLPSTPLVTADDIREMTLAEWSEFRSQPSVRGMFDRVVTDTSHPYHPENPFNIWRAARARFIETGSEKDFDKMIAAVRLEDADVYDKEAERD